MFNRISFEGHSGLLSIDTGQVEFYGATFVSMCRAVQLLRRLPSGQWYGPFFHRQQRGLVDTNGDVLVDGDPPRWFPDIEMAIDYCKELKLKKKNLCII